MPVKYSIVKDQTSSVLLSPKTPKINFPLGMITFGFFVALLVRRSFAVAVLQN